MDTENKCYDGPIYTNLKCIIISIAIAIGYWFAPPKNKWVLVSILYFTYVAIAWYDEYLCSKPLGPTYLRWFYEWAKPRKSYQSIKYSNLCTDIEQQIFTVDIIVFVIVLIALPYFLGWNP